MKRISIKANEEWIQLQSVIMRKAEICAIATENDTEDGEYATTIVMRGGGVHTIVYDNEFERDVDFVSLLLYLDLPMTKESLEEFGEEERTYRAKGEE